MVKVGDRVRVVGYNGLYKGYDSHGTTGIVTRIHYNGNIDMRTDKGFIRCGHMEDFSIIPPELPEKITQNGYEYSLVGPVKPEWLVDGAWVVRKDNGETHQINQKSENSFSATSSLSRVTGLTVKRVAEEFRPHDPKDWKWGDWAMYDGKRVFVMKGIDRDGDVAISGVGIGCTGTNYCFTKPDKLTPTF